MKAVRFLGSLVNCPGKMEECPDSEFENFYHQVVKKF